MIKSCLLIVIAIIAAAVFVWKGLHTEPLPAAVSGEAPKAAKAELELLKRQFQTTDDYQKRLEGQHLTERDLAARITAAQTEQQALDARMPRITEAQARAWYDANKETLRIPPAFHAAHVFLTRHEKSKPDRRAEIRAVHQQIVSAQLTFAGAAAKFSEDTRTKKLQGDLGWFTRDRMPADLVQAVESMKPGEVSAPFLTGLGWHIVQMLEARPSRLPSFQEALPEIRAMLELKAREATLAQP